MTEDNVGAKVPPAETNFSTSANLANRLGAAKTALSFTSYQSGLLYFVGQKADGGLNIHQTAMPKPMGLCLDDLGGLTLTGEYQITRFENVLEEYEQINNSFDSCYVPRLMHVTGRLDAHDVGVDTNGDTLFVNTRFNCLARPSMRHSFEEVWRPPFISALIDEDRCHLNGLAMENGKPRYMTAISKSNTIDGWRDRRAEGGIIIDVQANKIVCEGLSMPHSPRVHDGELWVLNSGTGELGVVEFDGGGKGAFKPRVFCPGFLRGLRFMGNVAVVGLSKPRYKRFEGLELDKRLKDVDSEPWCGLQFIDLSKGSCVDWLRIDGAVSELFDLEVLPNAGCAMAIRPMSSEVANLITYEKN